MFFSVQEWVQEARPCGLLPHPALFLGELSIPGNIPKGQRGKPGLGQNSAPKGLHCQANPSPPGNYWILHQESQLVPRNSGPFGGEVGVEGGGEAQHHIDLRSSFLKD